MVVEQVPRTGLMLAAFPKGYTLWLRVVAKTGYRHIYLCGTENFAL